LVPACRFSIVVGSYSGFKAADPASGREWEDPGRLQGKEEPQRVKENGSNFFGGTIFTLDKEEKNCKL
jgi:hypothetical protein